MREDDDTDHAIPIGGPLTVNNAEAYQFAGLAGLGLIQARRSGVGEALDHGRLVEVLPDFRARPMQLVLVYANRRNQPARARVVMDWLSEVVTQYVQ